MIVTPLQSNCNLLTITIVILLNIQLSTKECSVLAFGCASKAAEICTSPVKQNECIGGIDVVLKGCKSMLKKHGCYKKGIK